MNQDRIAQRLEQFRSSAERASEVEKDSQAVLEKLKAFYQSLSHEEKLSADRVLAEWLLSDDEGRRFDAEALIDEMSIASAMASLQSLRRLLVQQDSPGAVFELKKVGRIIASLETPNAND